MSIVRIGLAETKGFSDGYDAIFGKKKPAPQDEATPLAAKPKAKKAKSASKKKGKK